MEVPSFLSAHLPTLAKTNNEEDQAKKIKNSAGAILIFLVLMLMMQIIGLHAFIVALVNPECEEMSDCPGTTFCMQGTYSRLLTGFGSACISCTHIIPDEAMDSEDNPFDWWVKVSDDDTIRELLSNATLADQYCDEGGGVYSNSGGLSFSSIVAMLLVSFTVGIYLAKEESEVMLTDIFLRRSGWSFWKAMYYTDDDKGEFSEMFSVHGINQFRFELFQALRRYTMSVQIAISTVLVLVTANNAKDFFLDATAVLFVVDLDNLLFRTLLTSSEQQCVRASERASARKAPTEPSRCTASERCGPGATILGTRPLMFRTCVACSERKESANRASPDVPRQSVAVLERPSWGRGLDVQNLLVVVAWLRASPSSRASAKKAPTSVARAKGSSCTSVVAGRSRATLTLLWSRFAPLPRRTPLQVHDRDDEADARQGRDAYHAGLQVRARPHDRSCHLHSLRVDQDGRDGWDGKVPGRRADRAHVDLGGPSDVDGDHNPVSERASGATHPASTVARQPSLHVPFILLFLTTTTATTTTTTLQVRRKLRTQRLEVDGEGRLEEDAVEVREGHRLLRLRGPSGLDRAGQPNLRCAHMSGSRA
jgi:hypothetical protein